MSHFSHKNEGGNSATFTIITNDFLRAQTQAGLWISDNKLSKYPKIICSMTSLFKLPDGAQIHVLDYRIGGNRHDLCHAARCMVERGNFIEMKMEKE